MAVKLSSGLENETAEVVATAEEHIRAAAELLRPLGAEYNRVAWILEDTITCLEEAESNQSLDEMTDFPDITAIPKVQLN